MNKELDTKKNFVSIIIVTYNREKDIELCLDSILKSSYKNYEIVVVDNASTDNTLKLLENKYRNKIKIIKSDKNLMAGGGRNLGAEYTRGKFLLFIDSDNIVHFDMIRELVKGILKINDAGMVGPLMYYLKEPKTIWWAGANINLWTSKTDYIDWKNIDLANLCDREVGHIPNIFMCYKKDFDLVKGFDEKFGIMYEESDLAEKIKKLNKKIYLIHHARGWHNIPLKSDSDNPLRSYGVHSKERAYLISRNRIYYMKKNTNLIQYLLFVSIFLPIFSMCYLIKILRHKEYKIAKDYVRGIFDGLFKIKYKNKL